MKDIICAFILLGIMFIGGFIGWSFCETYTARKLCNNKQYDFCRVVKNVYAIDIKGANE